MPNEHKSHEVFVRDLCADNFPDSIENIHNSLIGHDGNRHVSPLGTTSSPSPPDKPGRTLRMGRSTVNLRQGWRKVRSAASAVSKSLKQSNPTNPHAVEDEASHKVREAAAHRANGYGRHVNVTEKQAALTTLKSSSTHDLTTSNKNLKPTHKQVRPSTAGASRGPGSNGLLMVPPVPWIPAKFVTNGHPSSPGDASPTAFTHTQGEKSGSSTSGTLRDDIHKSTPAENVEVLVKVKDSTPKSPSSLARGSGSHHLAARDISSKEERFEAYERMIRRHPTAHWDASLREGLGKPVQGEWS